MRLILDIETNGLLQELTEIHCIAVRDVDSDWSSLIVGHDDIKTWLHLASALEHVYIGHNIFGFDNEAIKKIYQIDLTKSHRIEDTFILSQLFYGDLAGWDFKHSVGIVEGFQTKNIGSHSLQAWGQRLKCYKGDYKGGFEEYNEEMGLYCQQDTLVTKELYKYFESIVDERINR